MMKPSMNRWPAALVAFGSILAISIGASFAFQVRPRSSRFEALVVDNPKEALDVATMPAASLDRSEGLKVAWEGFLGSHGRDWSVYLDRRSGAPLLVEGQGIPWSIDASSTVDSLAESLRTFIAANRSLLLADPAEMVVDHFASGLLNPDVWQIVFTRAIGGVPVDGERYLFTLGHGRLISFGAPRWSPIDASPFPDIDAAEAMARLTAYMGLKPGERVDVVDKGTLRLIPLRAPGTQVAAGGGPYTGAVGKGYTSALAWRVTVRVDGEPGTWEALVDAHSGQILSLDDVNEYAQAKGGVYPVSNDHVPPDGVEQAGWPMPYADVTIGAGLQTASALGFFNCTPGGATATTTLSGAYVRVVDTCGTIAQSMSCDADVDLGISTGTDCVVPAGGSAGNTHASRTGYYHLNRIAEHARSWLPGVSWLTQQLTDNVNINQTCNAYWNGASVNFFKSGGGCANTGELPGVFLHEWGHGLDQNDGGGYDSPSEAYADITSIMWTHVSCVGRGFTAANCTGYGDACLNCTGIRDQDWNQHNSHAPATPAVFLTNHCPSGTGPCGKEIHCESYIGAEAMWDLATRTLPASGLDLASSWQLADKLWYTSRLGSGGNAYNCALPSSDGCSATSWFEKMRAVDDDDGNLANGTPHAAAIFSAFSQHAIACGTAGDLANQSTTSCPAIGAPVLTAAGGSSSAQLTWTAVAHATAYNILRNDASCAAGSTIIATVPGLSYVDTGLANGFTEYYTVQAVGSSAACDGLLSNCRPVTPQPFAGLVKLDAATYGCQATIQVKVTDGNLGAATTTVKIASGTEPAGETITLTQVSPSSALYMGTIATTGGPVTADGAISVVNGDTITATYVDADDGQGGTNLTRTTTAQVDCLVPIITNVAASNVTGVSARVTWTTNEPATGLVRYGLAAPPGSTAGSAASVVAHAVDLSGLAECSTYVYAVESTDPSGNTAHDTNANAYYTFQTPKNTTPNFPSVDGPIAIPDNNPVGASSTIVVPDNKAVQNVKVKVNITHTFVGDLALSLIPPAGPAIALATNIFSSGGNYTDTVFDDAAATPITSGAAPFTGAFRPQSPLAALNGINAAGSWQLHVVDNAGQDVGTIDGWTLSLTYPAAPCGPHALYQSFASVTDTCATGGPGNASGTWDPGEQVSFKVTIKNDGNATLTNVHATVTATTPGVTMTNGTASFPSIAVGASVDSIAPHVTAFLPRNLACGATASFQISIASDQGTWSGGTFSHAVGVVTPALATPINEAFNGGIPATWIVIDGGTGGGVASTWTTANPGDRTFVPPLSAPVAMVDSDKAGSASGVTQDEQLITPPLDLSAATAVTLQFDQYFRYYTGGLSEVGDVDVRSSLTAPAWVNVLSQQTGSSPNPDHRSLDITAEAAGAINVQVRFHYYNAHWEFYWMVDNVRIDTISPGSCSENACVASGGVAKPVPDGSFGSAITASRVNASGTAIALTWDVVTCASTDHHIVYGDLATVASAMVAGSVCDLGATGNANWAGVPAGNLWFVVVGDDNATTEGSWGTTSAGERGGATVSGQCGITTRDNSASCP